MSLFPRFSSHHDSSIHPLFRLLEDPLYRPSQTNTSNTSVAKAQRQIFQPNFDVHETKDAYILDGELAGLSDKNDIDIEFVDSQTLVVKGRLERSYTNTNVPENTATSKTDSKPPKPTVEDDSTPSNETVKESTNKTTESTEDVEVGQHKFWVSERTVGEFQRSFTFPQGIDQDAVKATLNHGILSITVPKKQMKGSRKIAIE